MTANDKKLLIMAVAFLLVFAIAFLGVRPAVSKITETKAKNDELSAQKTEMVNEIAAIPTYEKNLDAAKTDYAKTAARVFGDLTNDKIHDAVVDELVTPCGLQISDFTITAVSQLGISPYAVVASETGGMIGQGGESKDPSTVRLANITVNVVGTTDQIITFVDSLNADEGIYLSSVSFANTVESTNVTVSFYMVLTETFA